jgi:DNA-binding IclR family transcriptional regulator
MTRVVQHPTMWDEAGREGNPENAERKSPYRLKVLDRAIAVLDALAASGDSGLNLPKVAESVGVAKSTAHRLLMVLGQHRLVFWRAETDSYVLGIKLFQLGSLAAPQKHLRDRAHRYLDDLAEETGETAHLAVLDDGQVLHLDKIESDHALRIAVVRGTYGPATSTALGKVLLAELREDQIDAIIRKYGLASRTNSAITSIAELKQHLRLVREHGYALDNEEYSKGLRCVAAPVRGPSGEVLGALGVAGPSIRLSDERIPCLVKLVVEAANRLSEELGAHHGSILFSTDPETARRLHS